MRYYILVPLTHNIADIGWSSILQQQQHDVQVTHERCHMDGSQTGLHIGAQEKDEEKKKKKCQSCWIKVK